MRRFYTAESVTEGHPDKVCDQIADAILDECLRYDPSSRVACEVLATRGNVFVAGEITSGYEPPVFDVIRKVLEECGYCTDGIEMLLALTGGHEAAHGIRYFCMVLFAGAVWPLTFRWFGHLGGGKRS